MKKKERKKKYVFIKPKKFVYTKEEKKQAKIKELKPLLRYFSNFKGLLILVGILLAVTSVVSVLFPIYSGKMIALFGENFNAYNIIKYAAIIAVLMIFNSSLNFVNSRIWSIVVNNTNYLITKDLILKINSTSQKRLENTGSGVFISRMQGDVTNVCEAPMKILSYVVELLTTVNFVTYLFQMQLYVGLYVFVYLLILVGLEFYIIDIFQRNRKTLKRIGENESSLNYENLRGIKDLRGIDATDNLVDKSLGLRRERLRFELGGKFIETRVHFAVRFARTILDFGLIGLCGYLVCINQIEITAALIIYNFRGRITGFAKYITGIKEYMSKCCLSAQRLNEIFDDNKFPTEKFGDKTLENFEGNVEFKNVKFAYATSEVLKGVSFVIKPNCVTSLVGASGSGKSTIVSLICKLYNLDDTDCGEIVLDGVNINELTCDSIRKNVALISQDPYIFNLTIAENMRLAKPNATEQEIIEALKLAYIWDFVDQLPEKLDSKLGENGVKVSGGQKQRFAIARALLTNSKILLFDEATSALDNNSQKLIKDVVKSLAKNHTIVFVAHRLSTVVDSDNIIVVEDGKINAQGTHEQLMTSCKYYHDLYAQEDLQKKLKI